MSGKLYVVPTPIGNLGDMSPRAVETLREVDFIAAEDTRVTIKLLNHFDMKKEQISYHQHNIEERGEVIMSRILGGESCAVCSDAGTPAVSDPGEVLVRQASEQGVEVVPIPGPCAAITALCASGLPTGRFCFEGFITTNRKNRLERLEQLKDETRTLIVYEAPHKLYTTLCDLCDAFGDREVAVCHELTKIHEKITRTTLFEARDSYADAAPKGEFVLIIGGARPEKQEPAAEEPRELLSSLMRDGMSASAAAREAAQLTGLKKNALYSIALELKDENE